MIELTRNQRLAGCRRIIIFRPGTLGDTVVALPALRLIARAFPDSERRVLTEFSGHSNTTPLAQIIEGSDLVHGYIRYPSQVRNLRTLNRLREEIRRFRPDALVYLAAPIAGLLKIIRDVTFFRCCGISRIVGVPYASELRQPQPLDNGLFEYEGARLLRCLRDLGDGSLEAPEAFDLKFTTDDRCAAGEALRAKPPGSPILAISIGTKVAVKDWGDNKWSSLLSQLSGRLPDWSVVTLGSAAERGRSEQLLTSWRGHRLNLCGALSVRGSAAVLERAQLFVGHDSGPMHLAAAVGTVCVAIFSSRHLPGVWFPWGSSHRVIYNDVPCRGCNLDDCFEFGKKCITSITVNEVMQQIEIALSLNRGDTTAQAPENMVRAT